jgi:hypothetical protein
MSQLHERPLERFGRLIDESVELLREQGFTWNMIRESLNSCVNMYELSETIAEPDIDPDDENVVNGPWVNWCPVDDERGAA